MLYSVKGKRFCEHIILNIYGWNNLVIVPTFYLMADKKFRKVLKENGLMAAIIFVCKYNED